MADDQQPEGGPQPFDPAGFLAARGINPDDIPDGQPRRRFDPVQFRMERARAVLDARTPAMFADARPDHPDVVAWVRRYLADPQACPSLLLLGKVGVGKTHQLWGSVRVIVEVSARNGRPPQWEVVTHPDLNAATRPSGDPRLAGLLDRCLHADLTAVDDIGAGKSTEWTEDVLFRLVDYRWSHRLPTIYSTNLVGDKLTAAVSARVESRMADAVRVQITGQDRRWSV